MQRWLPLPMWQIGTVLMLLMTCVNLMSARAYGEFEFWFSSIKVAAIMSFIVIVGAHAFGFVPPGGPTFSTLVAYGGFAPQRPVCRAGGRDHGHLVDDGRRSRHDRRSGVHLSRPGRWHA